MISTISITDREIRVVELEVDKTGVVVKNYFSKATFQEVLTELKAKKVYIFFSDKKNIFRFLILPQMPEREIMTVAKREIEREFGKEIVSAGFVSEIFAEGDVKRTRVSYSILDINTSKKYLSMCGHLRSAGFNPIILAPLSLLLSQAVSEYLKEKGHIGVFYSQKDVLFISFANDRRVIFARDIPVSASETDAVSSEIVRSILFFRSRFGVSPEKSYFSGENFDKVSDIVFRDTGVYLQKLEIPDLPQNYSMLIPLTLLKPKNIFVNFIPYENPIIKYREPIFKYSTSALVALLSFQIVISLFSIRSRTKLLSRKAEISEQLKYYTEQTKNLEAKALLTPSDVLKAKAIESSVGKRTSSEFYAKKIAEILPDKVSLNQISMQKEQDLWVLKISGAIREQTAVSAKKSWEHLLNLLREEKSFKEIRNSNIKFYPSEFEFIGSFNIDIALKNIHDWEKLFLKKKI